MKTQHSLVDFFLKHKPMRGGNPEFSRISQLIQQSDKNQLLNELKSIDINIQDENGMTPVYLASLLGNYEIVEILLRQGADPNIAPRYNGTQLPLLLGVFLTVENTYSCFKTIQLLINYGISDEFINQVIEYRSPTIGSVEKEFVKRQMEHKNFRQKTRSLAKTEIQQQYQRQDELEINNHVIKLVTTR